MKNFLKIYRKLYILVLINILCGGDKYVRNVYKYSGFENLVVDYSDASKYLNSNIKEGLLWNSNIEEVKGIPEDYGYGERLGTISCLY